MLLEGDIIDGTWKADRLLVDDGIASFFTAHPVGADAPEHPPALLMRAVEAQTAQEMLGGWPIRQPEIEHRGAPERVVTGPEGGKVLFDIFDVAPGAPVFSLGRRMAPREAMDLLFEACAVVEAHHRSRWLCRTLNPQSFFRAGNSQTLCLFPPACTVRFDLPLKEVLGTPGYIAPEAWKPAKASPRMDVYALGAVAWAWLSGEHPYAEEDSVEEIRRLADAGPLPDLSERIEDLPRGAVDLIRRCTGPHHMDRPRFVADVARLAREVISELARSGAESGRPAPRREPEEREAPAGEKPKSRATRIMPFSLDEIIDATEGEGD